MLSFLKSSKKRLKQNPTSNSKLDPKLLAEIKKLHLSTKKIADETLLGGYRSAFKGRGIEFEDVREYSPGDDVRTIDWKVTARSGQAFVKRFREERELSVLLAVDVSASSLTGSHGKQREALSARVGAVFTLIAMQNNDKVGLVTYSDRVESYHPPRKARNAVWRIIREVMTPGNYNPGTNLDGLNQFILGVLKRRSVVILISDFFDPSVSLNLAQLSRRHDLTTVVIEDPTDYELPKTGLTRVRNPETGEECLLDTSWGPTRKKYQQSLEQHRNNLEQCFKKAGAGSIWLRTDKEFLPLIKQFFHERSRAKSSIAPQLKVSN